MLSVLPAHGAACIYGRFLSPLSFMSTNSAPCQTTAQLIPAPPNSLLPHSPLLTLLLVLPQHKGYTLPPFPLRRRLHPQPHRRHPQRLGPPRRLGLFVRPPRPGLHNGDHAIGFAKVLGSECPRPVFRPKVCAASDGEVVREEELYEQRGQRSGVREHHYCGECCRRVRRYVDLAATNEERMARD